MDDNHRTLIKPGENQQLSAALTQMPEAEVARLLDTIEALQVDLLRLIPLFNGEEPAEAVTYTQYLLKILSDEINRVLAVKQARGIRDHLQNLHNEGARIDYTPALRLLSKVHGNKRRLIWAGMDGAK